MGLLKKRPVGSLIVALICVVVSFLPLAWQNAKHTGDWAGDPFNKSGMKLANPYLGLVGNGLEMVCQNMVPPVMPAAKLWNAKAHEWLRCPQRQSLVRGFPCIRLDCEELQQEEAAGLGMGICVLLMISSIAGLRSSPPEFRHPARKLGSLICLGGWVALAVYMAKMGSESAARLVLPYYPLLIVSVLLLPGSAILARRRWWKILAFLAAFSVLPSLILTPSRPLWPALSVSEKLCKALPGNPLAARMHMVYSTYHNRNDGLAPLRSYFTDEDKIVGFLGADDSEVALWRPFGVRRVVDIPRTGIPLSLKNCAWRMVARVEAFPLTHGQPMESWIATNGGRIVAREWIATKASQGPQQWCILQFDPLSQNITR